MAEHGPVTHSRGAPRRPETMLVMSAAALRAQFGAAEHARLAAAAALGDPVAAAELDSPPARARLGGGAPGSRDRAGLTAGQGQARRGRGAPHVLGLPAARRRRAVARAPTAGRA